MLEKLAKILPVCMAAAVGAFVVYGLYVFGEIKARPARYAMQSAPWYTGILLYGAVTAAVLAALWLLRLAVRARLKRRQTDAAEN